MAANWATPITKTPRQRLPKSSSRYSAWVSDFSVSWALCRQRLDDAVFDLNDEQLSWRIYPGALSIAQMVVHVAGVEVSFISQLQGTDLGEEELRLKASATDGVVNDKPFPFSDEELTAERVKHLLSIGRSFVEPVITAPSEDLLGKELVSALGPVITGKAALARLAFHPAYHHGQAYQIRSAPGFPASK